MLNIGQHFYCQYMKCVFHSIRAPISSNRDFASGENNQYRSEFPFGPVSRDSSHVHASIAANSETITNTVFTERICPWHPNFVPPFHFIQAWFFDSDVVGFLPSMFLQTTCSHSDRSHRSHLSETRRHKIYVHA